MICSVGQSLGRAVWVSAECQEAAVNCWQVALVTGAPTRTHGCGSSGPARGPAGRGAGRARGREKPPSGPQASPASRAPPRTASSDASRRKHPALITLSTKKCSFVKAYVIAGATARCGHRPCLCKGNRGDRNPGVSKAPAHRESHTKFLLVFSSFLVISMA